MFALARRVRDRFVAKPVLHAEGERRLAEESAARARAEVALARAAFLADVSRVLADGADPAITLPTVARLAVPFIADACVIDLMSDGDGLVRAAVAHRDPATVTLAEELLPRAVPDARHLDPPRSLCLASAIVVPLIARDRRLGVLSLVSAESPRHFDEADLAVAEDLARRVALAVESARLYREAVDGHRRVHELLRGVGAVVWEADAVRLHHTFVSECAPTLFGHPLKRWLDQPDFWLAVQHPDDRERSALESRAARAEGRDHDLEYRVIAADGRVVWTLDLVRLVRHPDGSVRQLRGIMVDVSESKRREHAIGGGEEARR